MDRKIFIGILCLLGNTICIKAQTSCTPITTANCSGIGAGSQIELTGEPVINFTFYSFGDYLRGVNLFGQSVYKIIVAENAAPPSDCRWFLSVHLDNNASPATEWENIMMYGTTTSPMPQVNLLEMRFRNTCNTSLTGTNYVSLPSTALNIPIVNSPGVSNAGGTCTGINVNRPGSHITNYGEYSFTVDYRVRPTLNLQPGVYLLNVKFCLREGL